HEAMQPEFAVYVRQILSNAQALAGALLDKGTELITGGTDNHLMIMNVHKSFGINGREAQELLESIGITTNANTIPDDSLPPFAPSGLRLGTPAITTRGLKEVHMQQIADIIVTALKERGDKAVPDSLRQRVKELAGE
ncbi:MAG TPA: serine hydroxymethyltransferase, partial [Candidatus Saccharibacteria bacterium]|nr:serine hydroxymethyltransferase [Candidatus Saccharibacteria bacterium]